jgi:hypothetical protein
MSEEEQPLPTDDSISVGTYVGTVRRIPVGFWRSMLTGPDNNSIDIARFGLLLTIGVALGLSVYVVIITKVFVIAEFAQGMATLLGFGAAAIAVKHHTEPRIDSVSQQ